MQNWGGENRKRYQELKDKVKRTLIEKVSAVIPDLVNRIEFEDAATPLTYERFTHNTDGASSAWSWNPKKRFHTQPMGAVVDTPVKNLLIGSCWATQIGGIPGAIEAAYQCVKHIG
jgi:phytoene dehydrogenase-like protein